MRYGNATPWNTHSNCAGLLLFFKPRESYRDRYRYRSHLTRTGNGDSSSDDTVRLSSTASRE